MTIQTIPTTPSEPYYVQTTRLDGRDFVLHFSYNQRLDRYYLAIHDDEDVPLVSGIKLIANWPLLRSYQWDDRLPPGELTVADLTGDGTPPGLDDLGAGHRCELAYRSVG